MQLERFLSYWIVLFIKTFKYHYSSVTEIQLNKLRSRFPTRFAPMIRANSVPLGVWGGGDYIIGANQAGKCAQLYLHNG